MVDGVCLLRGTDSTTPFLAGPTRLANSRQCHGGLSPRKPGFNPRSVQVRIIAHRIGVSQSKAKHINQSHYRPGHILSAPRISRPSAHVDGKVVSPTHRPTLLPWDIPGTYFCYRLCRTEGFFSEYCGFSPVNIMPPMLHTRGWGSSVGIATRYGLEGPGIESRWGRDFPHLSRPALGPTQSPVQLVPGLSRG